MKQNTRIETTRTLCGQMAAAMTVSLAGGQGGPGGAPGGSRKPESYDAATATRTCISALTPSGS